MKQEFFQNNFLTDGLHYEIVDKAYEEIGDSVDTFAPPIIQSCSTISSFNSATQNLTIIHTYTNTSLQKKIDII